MTRKAPVRTEPHPTFQIAGRTCAAGDSFSATFEAIGGAHRTFRILQQSSESDDALPVHFSCSFIRVICGLSPLQKLRPANHADIRERLTIEFRLPIPIALPHPTRSRQARLSKPMGLVNQSTQAIHGSSHHEAG
jgi:hypothetical protein